MDSRGYILGIDTSNYKTSIAVVDPQKNIICDLRRLLKVKQGEKGLRQSDALFQHIKNLPELMTMAEDKIGGKLEAVAYSSRPRPIEGSYMPVFLAGESLGKSIASAMGIPAVAFSHQEGHIEAIKAYSELNDIQNVMACHFSGGTCELLEVIACETGYNIDIIGGSEDISFGQVLDRAGVAMNMAFPAGEEMDKLAVGASKSTELLTPIKVKNCHLNLSGIDTQIKNIIEKETPHNQKAENDIQNTVDSDRFIREIFEKLSEAIVKLLIQGSQRTGSKNVIMAGGVSSSRFIRKYVTDRLKCQHINPVFGHADLSQDNAIGTALLGGKYIWR